MTAESGDISRRKTVLVLGAGGMMGHMACRVFAEEFVTYGTARAPFNTSLPLSRFLPEERWLPGIDVTDFSTVERTIQELRPDVVFNAVGVIKQLDAAHDPLACIPINAMLPHQLAQSCSRIGARLIHLSTDCVFSGKTGDYSEDDNPDPVDLYGRTKLIGETTEPGSLTLRTSIIGRQLTGNSSLLEWAISQKGKTVKGFTGAIYTGLTTETLARVVSKIIGSHRELSGVYQVASEPINKYELLVKINNALELGLTIIPDEKFRCDRSLNGSRFRQATNIVVPSWDEMVAGLASDRVNYEESEVSR